MSNANPGFTAQPQSQALKEGDGTPKPKTRRCEEEAKRLTRQPCPLQPNASRQALQTPPPLYPCKLSHRGNAQHSRHRPLPPNAPKQFVKIRVYSWFSRWQWRLQSFAVRSSQGSQWWLQSFAVCGSLSPLCSLRPTRLMQFPAPLPAPHFNPPNPPISKAKPQKQCNKVWHIYRGLCANKTRT